MEVRPGVEVLLHEKLSLLRGQRVGLVVHPASVLSSLQHSADALAAEKSVRLVSLFGPQHGARGEKQDNMVESGHYLDPDLRLLVHSLYSETRRPTERMMSDLDVLVFDLQDVGTRVYTFVYTMVHCMQACARFGKRMVVLDRPNPITGRAVEGNLLESEFTSFVGMYPLPMRHGMTTAELALLFNAEFGIGCDLAVVGMQGWKRSMWFDETGLPWVMPSPNLPTLDSATVYPGMVLVEGSTVSEGRGTTRPFELVGAPYVNSKKLADRLNSLALPGVHFRAAHFQPTFQKWAGHVCGGVQVHVVDRDRFEPYLTGTVTLAAIRDLYPRDFEWGKPPYEYEREKMPIEILAGGRSVVDHIERNSHPERIRNSWKEDQDRFERTRQAYLLYG